MTGAPRVLRLQITDDAMTSNISDHTAKRLAKGGDRWLVSWLHDRQVSRDQAISAMTIAGIVAIDKNPERDHRLWSFIDNLACELGMRASDAIVQASTDPTAERSEVDINEAVSGFDHPTSRSQERDR